MTEATNETKFQFGDKDILFREYFDDNFSDIDKIPTQSLGIILNDQN